MLRPLFENHLAFMGLHRGEVHAEGGGLAIHSEAPGVASWVPLAESAAPPDGCVAVRLVPWSGEGWPERLAAGGFRPAEALSYMELPEGAELGHATAPPEVEIAVVADAAGAETFARVQSAGFLDETDPASAWWRRCFHDVARRNHARPDQTLYMARSAGEPAAVALVLRAAGVSGIYAVATRPEHRRKGLSTALLGRAVEDARRSETPRVTLAATVGSYAEGLYQRLGFVALFRSQVWRKAPDG